MNCPPASYTYIYATTNDDPRKDKKKLTLPRPLEI